MKTRDRVHENAANTHYIMGEIGSESWGWPGTRKKKRHPFDKLRAGSVSFRKCAVPIAVRPNWDPSTSSGQAYAMHGIFGMERNHPTHSSSDNGILTVLSGVGVNY